MRIAMIQRDLAVPARAGMHLRLPKLAEQFLDRGHEVRYFCFELDQRGDLPFRVETIEPAPEGEAERWLRESKLMRSLLRYWATSPRDLLGLYRAVEQAECDVILTAGLQGLMYLRYFPDRCRVWYGGDELFAQCLSQLSIRSSFKENRQLLTAAARLFVLQRISRDIPDVTWMVAPMDVRAMLRVLGKRDVRWIPNGVDFDYFSPVEAHPRPNTAVFWGRLDFVPNEQALDYFLRSVWPLVRAAHGEARLIVMGYSPTERVRALATAEGVELVADAPDIRPVVCSAPVAIFPFVSGTGIKNKVLEGAALARALLVSPLATNGLRTSGAAPWRICESPEQWRDALLALWRDSAAAAEAGAAARSWVERNHSWERAGALAEASIQEALARRQNRR
jgi:glycosyltransferase involved in cell wall biosynthesis